MTIDKSPTSPSTCDVCGQRIKTEALRVVKLIQGIYRKYYHLACYQPSEAQILTYGKDVSLRRIEKSEDLERIKQWVAKWNAQFLPGEETLPAQYKSKAVETTSSPLRRLLLETFQYLDLREIERIVAFVCKQWFHVSRDNELWKLRYLSEFHSQNLSGEGLYRTKFIVQFRTCCWLCNKPVSATKLKLFCSIRKRPFCVECSKTEAGRILPIHNFFNYRWVTPALVNRLHFRHFIHHKIKQSYLSDMVETILPYAEQRKKALLEALQNENPMRVSQAQLTDILNFDLRAFYCDTRQFFNTRMDFAMGTLCGTNSEGIEFSESVAHFLRRLAKP